MKDEEVWLINANIPEFSHGNRFNHEPKRPRKLLLTHREIAKLHGAVDAPGHDARAAVDLFQLPRSGEGRARAGAGQEGARQARNEKERDWKREQGRLMRQHG